MALEFSYYTIDDLRKGHDGKGVTGWRQDRFLDRKGALLHYRHIPDTGVKALGIRAGDTDIDLIHCVPLFKQDTSGDSLLVTGFLSRLEGKEKQWAVELAREWCRLLNVCFCLDGDRIIPAPTTVSKKLAGKYLWPDTPGVWESAIQWLQVAEVGWIPPTGLSQRFPPNGDYQYPVILKCRVGGVTESGDYCGLEVTPYEFVKLKQKTQERINHRKK